MNERVILAAVLASLGAGYAGRGEEKPIAIGSGRELFVSRFLIGKMDRTWLVLHEPPSARSSGRGSARGTGFRGPTTRRWASSGPGRRRCLST